MHIVYIVFLGVSLGFSRALDAERWRSAAAGSGSDVGADASGSQVQRLVYAQHGRELMGLKSPVRAPPCSLREDTGSTSRRQLREGDRPWKGSRS